MNEYNELILRLRADHKYLAADAIESLRAKVDRLTARGFEALHFENEELQAKLTNEEKCVEFYRQKFIEGEDHIDELKGDVVHLTACQSELLRRNKVLEHESINTVLDASEEYGKLQAQVKEITIDRDEIRRKYIKEAKLTDELLTRIGKLKDERDDLEDNLQETLQNSEKIDQLEAQVKELEGLLKVASCPQCGPNKDGAYYDNMGEVHQCQWCHEVKAALQENEL